MARSAKKGPYVDANLVKKVASGMGDKGKGSWKEACQDKKG